MKKFYRIAVLGGGSFGTTLSNLMASKGHDVVLWLRSEERANEINTEHRNSFYLPNFDLHESMRASTDLSASIAHADIVFFAVPSKSSREVARQVAQYIRPDTLVVSTTKGIEPNGFILMSEVLKQELQGQAIGVLSGPNLAKEIAARQLTASVIASEDQQLIDTVQRVLQCSYFRVYASHDVYGVELGGALKNIYAIIAGMGAAMDMGANTQAMLITRALAEMSRFAEKLGANPLTFLGLAGIGDLVVTCSSSLSRNYQIGYAVGTGKSLDEAVDSLGQVAEGVNTLKIVRAKADEMGIYMPLVEGLSRILFEGRAVKAVIGELMLGELTVDVEFSSRDANA